MIIATYTIIGGILNFKCVTMAGKRDPDTPTDTEPKHMTSTPFSSDSKPDVAEMFKKIGEKLGWFQYNNLETAYKTVSFKYKGHFFI